MHSKTSSPSPSTVGIMTETSDGLNVGRSRRAAGLYKKQKAMIFKTSRVYRTRNKFVKTQKSEDIADKTIQAVGVMTDSI